MNVEKAGLVTIEVIRRLLARSTKRERLYLMIGLRASHFEESLVKGDGLRARAHLRALVPLVRRALA
jgi:hypothetical protein